MIIGTFTIFIVGVMVPSEHGLLPIGSHIGKVCFFGFFEVLVGGPYTATSPIVQRSLTFSEFLERHLIFAAYDLPILVRVIVQVEYEGTT